MQYLKKRCVWETRMSPAATKPKLAIFSIYKGHGQDNKFIDPGVIWRVSLATCKYTCQIFSIYLLPFRVTVKVKVGGGGAIDTDRQTKTRCPRIPFRGHKRIYMYIWLQYPHRVHGVVKFKIHKHSRPRAYVCLKILYIIIHIKIKHQQTLKYIHSLVSNKSV